MRKRGHRERGETTTEKKKRAKKEKNIYGSNAPEFHWLYELLWSCYSLSTRPAPFTAFFPLWKL